MAGGQRVAARKVYHTVCVINVVCTCLFCFTFMTSCGRTVLDPNEGQSWRRLAVLYHYIGEEDLGNSARYTAWQLGVLILLIYSVDIDMLCGLSTYCEWVHDTYIIYWNDRVWTRRIWWNCISYAQLGISNGLTLVLHKSCCCIANQC